MRKLKLQMQVSLDGFSSIGSNDDQTWVVWAWDEIKQHVLDIADSADTEIIGRKLAVDYIPYWFNTQTNPNDPMYELAKIKSNQKKVVFSKTLEKLEFENTVLEKGDLSKTVTEMKMQDGKDIIAYGGSSFASNLVKENLVDEYYLFINPVALGKGVSIFGKSDRWQQLKLIKSISFNSGIVLLQYLRK